MNAHCIFCGIDPIDLKVKGRSLILCHQRLQTFLHSLSVHFSPAGERDPLTELYIHRAVIDVFEMLRQPWLRSHRIGQAEQRLSYAIAYGTPSGIILVGI